MKSDYKTDLRVAQLELADLLNQRERLEVAIAKKRWLIAALAAQTDENEEIDQIDGVGMDLGGLTDACRTAFKSAFPKALSPVMVKERLTRLGFPTSEYKNILAAIHTVISRLFDAREIVPTRTDSGETGFKWNQLGRNALRQMATGKIDPDKLPDDVRGALYGPKKK